MLEVGMKAPDFTFQDLKGQDKKLSDLLGNKVVIYFYPKDMTPGCTKQACNFAQCYGTYQDKNVEVIGISKDSIASHDKFRAKYDLPFPLVSDEALSIIKAYDVWQEKNMYGKKVWGVVRTTYVIDEKGFIESVNAKVKAATNGEDVLAQL